MAEKWTLKGDMIGTCICTTVCPCIFGQDPVSGHCGAISAFDVKKGSYGSVDLSGRKLGVAFVWTGNAFNGNITVGLYVDDGASKEQVDAFAQIVTGKAGGAFEGLAQLFGEVKGTKQVPIEIKDGSTFQIGSTSGTVELYTGADQQGPLVVMNSPFDFSGKGLKIGKSSGRIVDPEWGFDFELAYGDTGEFDLAS